MVHIIYEIRCHIVPYLEKNFQESFQPLAIQYNLLYLAAVLLNNVLDCLFLDVVKTKNL